jgi:hypothetical protein
MQLPGISSRLFAPQELNLCVVVYWVPLDGLQKMRCFVRAGAR